MTGLILQVLRLGAGDDGTRLSPIPFPGLQTGIIQGEEKRHMVMKILAEGFGVFVLTLVLMVVFSMFLHGI